MDIYLRLKELREKNKLSKKEFSAKFGVNDSQYGKMEAGKIQPTINQIIDISSIFNTTTDWLLTGKESTLKTNTEISTNIRLPLVITIPEKDQEKENIEIVPVKLAAGYVGGGYQTEDFIRNLPKFRLPYLNNGTFRCFQIEGHSMDNGIKDQDWFVGRFTENLNNFAEGKIHAVIAPYIRSLLIKRVFRHPLKKETLILRSDNNDELMTYSDIEVNAADITELWSFTATISFTEPTYDAEKFKRIALYKPENIYTHT